MGRADGLGSVRGVRGLPSSYASSRVAATAETAAPGTSGGWSEGEPPGPHEAGGAVGLCAQSGDPRFSALDGPKRQAPTTLN